MTSYVIFRYVYGTRTKAYKAITIEWSFVLNQYTFLETAGVLQYTFRKPLEC